MNDQLPPHIGPQAFPGYGCTYEAGDGLCGQAAAVHIFWTEGGENGFTCTDHFEEAARFGGVDAHPMGTDCAARPSQWFPSTDDTMGFCVAELHPVFAQVAPDNRNDEGADS